MMKRIIVEKDNTILQKSYITPKHRIVFKKHKELSTPKFINKIMKQDLIILPKNTRLYKDYGECKLFVTEHPPQLRTIKIATTLIYKWKMFKLWCKRNGIKDGEKFFEEFGSKGFKIHTFNLLFPYMICITSFSQNRCYYFYVFLSNKPIVDFQTMLYKVPLSNIQRSQTVCMGSSVRIPDSNIFKIPVSEAIDSIFKALFEGSFNSDYKYNILSYQKIEKFFNFFIWSYLSHNDPMQILQEKLIEYKTLGEVIKSIEESYGFDESLKFLHLTNSF